MKKHRYYVMSAGVSLVSFYSSFSIQLPRKSNFINIGQLVSLI